MSLRGANAGSLREGRPPHTLVRWRRGGCSGCTHGAVEVPKRDTTPDVALAAALVSVSGISPAAAKLPLRPSNTASDASVSAGF